MEMFCYQCQETADNVGCTDIGRCGKDPSTANRQDLLIWQLRGLAFLAEQAKAADIETPRHDRFIAESLFATLTNVNFDPEWFENRIDSCISYREELRDVLNNTDHEFASTWPDAVFWDPNDSPPLEHKAADVGIRSIDEEDLRSLRETLTYAVKGIAAYADHALILGETEDDIFAFIQRALAATADPHTGVDELTELVLEAGEVGTEVMGLLDEAHTSTYGHPEPTTVDIGTGTRPGILISGHDLRDLEQLLEQTAGEGIDVYTHGEMLPAHAYPAFKQYDHFVGNYGNAWWQQHEEFAAFNGPILMTTNCLKPPNDQYSDRLYTTGVVRYPNVTHIDTRGDDGEKDFSALIEQAHSCDPPEQLESGSITNGFAHESLLEHADAIIDGIESGHIRGFVVMAGCDGHQNDRSYYTKLAQELPDDVIILTAGCAKYRYNKLDLGTINGVPRVIDAGQCNDSYSLLYVAQQLQDVLEVDDINDLPIAYDIAWYEQKAVTVLLALLANNVQGIRLGPTLPAFLSENILEVLVDEFDIKPNTTVQADKEAILTELA